MSKEIERIIIVFSTRYIDESSNIFRFAKPKETLSKPMCDYFLKENKKELTNFKKEKKKIDNADNSSREIAGPKLTFDIVMNCARNSEFMTKELLEEVLNKKSDNLKKARLKREPFNNDKNLQNIISKYEESNSGGNNEDDFNENDFLLLGNETKNINFDGYSKQKLKDRVTLYNIGANDGEYLAFAVWSLGDTPEILDAEKENAIDDSPWIDTLTKAIAEEVNDTKFELLLVLHDKDFNYIEKSDVFKSVYNNKVVTIKDTKGNTRTVVRSLTVFQHPQPEFNEIIELPASDDSANIGRTIWERADRIIRRTRIFQDLKKLQDDIVSDKVNDSESLNELNTTYERYWKNKEFDGLRIGLELINRDIKEISDIVSSIQTNISSITVYSSLNAILRSKVIDKNKYLDQVKRLDEKNPEDWCKIRQILMPLTAYCQGKSYLKYFLITEINEHLKKRMTNGSDDK